MLPRLRVFKQAGMNGAVGQQVKYTKFQEAKAKILELAAKVGVNVTPSVRTKEFNQQVELLELAAKNGTINPSSLSAPKPGKYLTLDFNPHREAAKEEIRQVSEKLQNQFTEFQNQLATLKAAPQQTTQTASLSTKDLASAAEAVFGANHVRGIADQCKDESTLRDRLERQFYFNNLSVPGHDLGHVANLYGPAKPPFGLARVQRADHQQKLDKWSAQNKK